MSRIGKKPISIQKGVTVEMGGKKVTVKGPKGTLERIIPAEISVAVSEKEILVGLREQFQDKNALWGLARSLIANMIEGVSNGFVKRLVFEGVGYRASVEGDSLVFQLGFSHPIRFKAPEEVVFAVEKNTITISGIDKELVGRTAAEVRMLKPPEPYKGKGIRYHDEVVRRKAGKKAVAAG
jgi:large subunit ribosomal protein L6